MQSDDSILAELLHWCHAYGVNSWVLDGFCICTAAFDTRCRDRGVQAAGVRVASEDGCGRLLQAWDII